MSYARINGTDLFYEVQGEGHPLVMSHGIGSNHLHWWQQVPEFSRRFQVITFDHRGFGLSKDANGLGPQAFIDDLEGLLDHLDVKKAFLCGQSMGGITVGGYAARHPEKVSALVLSCSGGGFFPVPHSDEFKAAVAKVKNYAEFSTLSIEQDGFPQRHPVLRYLFESMAKLNHDFNMSKLPGLRAHKFDPAQIAEAGIPVQLIGGEDDNGAKAAMVQIQAAIPGAKLDIIPGAGHLLFFEAASAYNRIVLNFLTPLALKQPPAASR
ncbi:putative non-heme bromoperoxidase BpoC [compost metagenome]